MDVIRFQPGDTLTEILDSKASTEQVRNTEETTKQLHCSYCLSEHQNKPLILKYQHFLYYYNWHETVVLLLLLIFHLGLIDLHYEGITILYLCSDTVVLKISH